jgi:hypothetical protein
METKIVPNYITPMRNENILERGDIIEITEGSNFCYYRENNCLVVFKEQKDAIEVANKINNGEIIDFNKITI